MSKSAPKVIGITLGDPAGIGPEVTAKALAKVSLRSPVRFLVIGDEDSFKRYFRRQGFCHSHVSGNPLVDARLRGHDNEFLIIESSRHPDFALGKPTVQSGELSFQFLQRSVELLKKNKIQAVVTAPLSKGSVCRFKPGFHGHTEYLANAFGVKKFDMMFVTDELKTVITTRHIPIAQVPRAITRQKVLDSIMLVDRSLRRQFKISRPRIAVCGLNPHAGEGGEIGREDIQKIAPAIKTAKTKGIDVSGPFAGDTMFVLERRKNFDAIVSMYHDQGLIAMKTLYFHQVVNLTIGLPFVRTSPAHGTAFDIAGKNKADASSMAQAIRLAVELV